jgi:hypothetical protein
MTTIAQEDLIRSVADALSPEAAWIRWTISTQNCQT